MLEESVSGGQAGNVGAGNSAGQTALHLARYARQVTMLVRGDNLTGRDVVRVGAHPSRWPLDRAPLPLETSMPGVFAAGDARYRSIKRVASAVGDGATAVRLAHEYLAAGHSDELSPIPLG